MVAPAYIQVYTLKCLQCGRSAGQLVGRHFAADGRAPRPVLKEHMPHCGVCGGKLFSERDGEVPRTEAERLIANRRRQLDVHSRIVGTSGLTAECRDPPSSRDLNGSLATHHSHARQDRKVAWIDADAIATTPAER